MTVSIVAIAALAAGAGAVAVAAGAWHPMASAKPRPASIPFSSTSSTPGPATTVTTVRPAPGLAAANPIVTENAKQGTKAWQIQPASGPTIEGFADRVSARPGQTVRVYVSTAAPHFHVEVYRMGYYNGTGGRLIATSPAEPGVVQPGCPVTRTVNMVSCSWTSPVTFSVDSRWTEGDYLMKLVADPGQASYVPLTVTDPASKATYLAINSVFTWQAWNPFGGYDMFGGTPTPGASPQFADRARVASYDRPYQFDFSGGEGSGDFLSIEYPFVRYAEQHGLNMTYATDVDVTENPGQMLQHQAVISLGHNEFWSAQERQGLIAARDRGVNLVFLGATPGLRPARLQAGPLGPDREMVAYRDPVNDPIDKTNPQLATANTWGQPPLNDPPSEIIGNTYGGYGINAPMIIVNPTAWPFAGLGLTRGAQLAHVIAGDYDHYVPGQPGPTDVEILAHSPVVTDYGHHDNADMIYYSTPSGAGVFSSGSIGWIPSLTPCPTTNPGCPAPAVQGITANVLRLFGQGPAGRTHPSVSNTADF